ncbi:MAG TPA: hypothetical protein GXZ66_11085, partial [Clostridiaceae bacterium]|nr:hypothetical protein [Clostridiaceae bacterium]
NLSPRGDGNEAAPQIDKLVSCRNLSPRGDGNVLVLAFVVGLVSRNLSLYGDVSNAKGTYDPSNPSNLSLNVVLFINLIISPK